jgi:hypothetical protein
MTIPVSFFRTTCVLKLFLFYFLLLSLSSLLQVRSSLMILMCLSLF